MDVTEELSELMGRISNEDGVFDPDLLQGIVDLIEKHSPDRPYLVTDRMRERIGIMRAWNNEFKSRE